MYQTKRRPVTVWKMLQERYQGKDKQRIRFLRSELSYMQFQGEDMANYKSKLQKLFDELFSAGCTASEEDDKIFLLLNTVPIEYHPFGTSITNAVSLTFKEGSSWLILECENLAQVKASSSNGVAFDAENRKPLKVVHNQPHGKSPKDTCNYCHIKDHQANHCNKRIASED
jgi:hypothetical protein